MMRFLCLGYLDEAMWSELSESEQAARIEACFAYDDELRRGGHFAGGEALGGPEAPVSLRIHDGRVVVTDGPFAETKELLGGLLILEARDREQAIELMSKHPGVGMGGFDVRPINEDFHAMVAARAAAQQ